MRVQEKISKEIQTKKAEMRVQGISHPNLLVVHIMCKIPIEILGKRNVVSNFLEHFACLKRAEKGEA